MAEAFDCHNIPGRRAADVRRDQATTRLRPDAAGLPPARAGVQSKRVGGPFRFARCLVLLDCNLTEELHVPHFTVTQPSANIQQDRLLNGYILPLDLLDLFKKVFPLPFFFSQTMFAVVRHLSIKVIKDEK